MLAALLVGLTVLAPAPALSADEPLPVAALAPGDVLFRRASPHDLPDARLRGALVRLADLALGHAVEPAQPLHVAIYLGDGQTAEAWGVGAADARVGRRRLVEPSRRGSAWRVLRHRDAEVRAALVEVAGRWATDRMRFAVPLDALARRRWDDDARRAARAHVAAFDVVGGPPEVDAMSCSELAVAALQSATAHVHGGVHALPPEAQLDARSTPSAVLWAWRASGAFDELGTVHVD